MTSAKVTWQWGIGALSIPTLQSSGLAGVLAGGTGGTPKRQKGLAQNRTRRCEVCISRDDTLQGHSLTMGMSRGAGDCPWGWGSLGGLSGGCFHIAGFLKSCFRKAASMVFLSQHFVCRIASFITLC